MAEFLSKGFREGFPLHYESIRVSSDAINLLSVLDNPEVVDAKLNKECEAGRLAGPFHHVPFHLFRVSPLGVVPKKTPGEFRLIHHLSYPRVPLLMMASPQKIAVCQLPQFLMPSSTGFETGRKSSELRLEFFKSSIMPQGISNFCRVEMLNFSLTEYKIFFKKSMKPKSMPFDILRRGSFAAHFGDHLRSNLGIISGLGIICGRGSFAALYRPYLLGKPRCT